MRKLRDFLANHHLHRPRCTYGAILSGVHFAYYGGVFIEAHGFYAYFGGGLAALMAVGFLLGEGAEG